MRNELAGKMRFGRPPGKMLRAPGAAWTGLAWAGLATGVLFATAAQAQEPPPLFRTMDENGVDLMTRELKIDDEILSVGHGVAKLKLRMLGNIVGVHHNFNGWASYEDDGNFMWFASVYFEDDRNTFPSLGQNIPSEQGDGATLTATSAEFVWTRSDGTVVIFNRTVSPGGNSYGQPTQIIYPGGHKVRIHYKTVGGPIARIQSVTSNHGYQLKLNYPSATSQLLSSAQAINNAVDYCNPTADSCTDLSQTWPTVTVAHSNSGNGPNVVTVTNSLNESRRYSFTADPFGSSITYWLAGIKEPGRAVDNVTLTYGSNPYNVHNDPLSITRDGVTYTYTWATPEPGYFPELVRTAPLGQVLATRRTLEGERPDYIRDGLNRTTDFTYDSMMRLARVTEPEGSYVQYSYDARGNITQTRHVAKSGSGLADIVTSATYSPTCANPLTCNKPITTTDALLRVTDYAYDEATGHMTSVTLPAPTGGVRPQTRYGYMAHQAYYKNGSGAIAASGESVSLPTSASACQTAASCVGTADEVRMAIGYGSQTPGVANNLLPVSSTVGRGDGALAATTAIAYDSLGNPLTVDGPLPGAADTTRYRYDAGQRTTGIVGADPDGAGPLKHVARRYAYNGSDQRTATETGALNSQSEADWSNFVALERAETAYDANGRKVTDRYVAGGVTHVLEQHSYDAAGRQECSAVRMNPALYANLPASACTLGTQGSFGPDRITKTIYDAAGQVTQVRRGVGTGTEVAEATGSYTQNGERASLTDAENNKTTFEYDGHDRPARTYFPSPTKGAGTSSPSDYEQYTHDLKGNVTALRLRDGNSLSFAFDGLDRMVLKVVPERAGLAASHTRDVHYGYDLLGRQTYARFDSATGEGVTNSYDVFGRLTSSTSSMGGVARTFNSQYDAVGNRIVLSSPSDYYASFAYDVLGRMTAYMEGAATIVRFDYDNSGRRSALTFAAGGTSTASYGYDPIGRLASLTRELAGTGADDIRTFAYNPDSQIVSRTGSNNAYAPNTAINVNRAYSANGLNQYLTAGPASFAYDSNGNLISDGSTSFVYDVENRLVSASGAKNATLTYDPLGRLWQTSGASGITRFVYDGNRLVEEYDGGGYRPRVYVHGPGADEPIVWYELAGGPVHRFYHSDHQGSIVALADDYGNSLGINAYDPWGIPNAGNIGRFGYTGQAWIPELGLWYYKARFYSPTLGRFMQTDPIGYGGGMNLYHYVGNDPVNRVDPSGLEEIVITGDLCTVKPCGGTSPTEMWDSFASGQRYARVENEKGEGGEPRQIAAATPKKAPCFTLNQHRAHHDKWVAREAARLRAEGYQVATEVSMRVWTPSGSVMARADIVARLPGSRYYLINEIKTGDARFSRNQNLVYNANVAVIAGTNGIAIGLPPGSHLPLANFALTRCKGLG